MFGLLSSLLLWVVIHAGTQPADPYIIVGRRQGIDRLNLDGSGKQEIIRFVYPRIIPLDLDYDFEQGYIFYYHGMVNSGDQTGIRRCTLTGQNDQPILEGIHRTPGRNDIWVDRRKRKLYRLTLHGSVFSEDYEGSKAGRKNLFQVPGEYAYAHFALAVAPSRGKICWGMQNHIACGNMDGSDIVRLVTGDWTIEDSGEVHPPNFQRLIVLDEEAGKIYFVSGPQGAEEIRSVDMDTHEQQTIIEGLNTRITDLWLHGDYIYFVSGGRHEIGYVMRCNKSGGGLVTLASGFEMLFGIAVVQPPRPNQPAPVDGRWGEWGPWEACSATCGTGSRTSRRFCNSPRPAHGGSFCEGPHTQTKTCNNGPCASYEYLVFPTTRGRKRYSKSFMSRVNLDGGEMQMMIDAPVTDMAYDAAENILFCLQQNRTEYDRTEIRRCRLSDEEDQVLVTLTRRATILTIQPDLKKIFVAEQYGDTIRRFDYDGTNEETVVSGVIPSGRLGDIAISVTMGRMFFTAPESIDNIFSTDLDGADVKVIRRSNGAIFPYYYDTASSLALDDAGEKLYFTVSAPEPNPGSTQQVQLTKNQINVIDLKTGVESTILTGLIDTHHIQLYNDRLFFSQSTGLRPKSIQSCDKSGKDLKTHFEDYIIDLHNFFVLRLVDAPWTDWSVWTACTETCGDGIRTRTRTCTGVQCYGQNYEIQECNVVDCVGPRDPGWADRKSQAVCSLFTTPPSGVELTGVSSALPASTEEEDEVLSCYDECYARYTKPYPWNNKVCDSSLRLYPNPADRLAQGKEQVHRSRVFDLCQTKWANICCCLN